MESSFQSIDDKLDRNWIMYPVHTCSLSRYLLLLSTERNSLINNIFIETFPSIKSFSLNRASINHSIEKR